MRDKLPYLAALGLAPLIVFVLLPLIRSVDLPIEADVDRPPVVTGSIDGCYTVRRGDNATTLSDRFWGNWKYYRHLLETNGRKYKTSNQILVIGEKIYINDSTYDQGQLEPPEGCPTPTPVFSGGASTEASR